MDQSEISKKIKSGEYTLSKFDGKSQCWKLFRKILDIDGSEIFGNVSCSKCLSCIVYKKRDPAGKVIDLNQESVGTHKTLQSICYWQHVWYCKTLFPVKCQSRSTQGQFCQSRRSKVSEWLSCTPLHISQHLEFIIDQGHRVNWVSWSLDSRVTGSQFHV